MSTRQHSSFGAGPAGRLGVTLIELVVVLAILVLLAAVAIPTLARMGALSHSELQDNARLLYGILRTARIYSSTFHVDTAVVYTQRDAIDSRTSEAVTVIDGLGIARRLRRDQIGKVPFEAIPVEERDDAFVMVQAVEGRFRKFALDTCIMNQIAGASTYTALDGLVPIVVYDDKGNKVFPLVPYPSATLADAFSAHVFHPTGLMMAGGSDVARFKLDVGPAPDADEESRFYVHKFEDGSQSEVGVPPVRVNLYQTTCRVEMDDEANDVGA